MHFAAKNYLRIIVSIAALARAIVVYGIPIANTTPAVEVVTAREELFGWPGGVVEEGIFGYPNHPEPEDIEREAISN
ncbi:hypothetical protein C8F04DRAFT_1248569 [Mycena alexandri]|uniref:Uncharacterized protein n=1 Tax=Mycena alexandri TaxID=1745969 RepID=A0AAD6TM28_9AGAR|nr:hypothetical protein C8F04DRAFT_1248569 [Mycena alexandri]